VTGGTAAFPGGTAYSADVSGGQRLSTAECAVRDVNQPCQEEKGRAVASVTAAVPGPPSAESVVNVLETQPLEFLAHIEELPPGAGPATLTFRLGRDVVGTTHPADVQIQHEGDPGSIPSCVGSAMPAGATNCVDRAASSYDTANKSVVMLVHTTQTSRYVCRKEDITAPAVTAVAGRWKSLKAPIPVTTTLDEAGRVVVTGTVKAKGIKLGLQTVSKTLAADTAGTLSLTFKKKLKKGQKKKLKKAKKVIATLTVTVVDATPAASTTVTVRVAVTFLAFLSFFF